MSSEERGPSYRDVDAYLQEMRDAHGVGTRFRLVPPIARIDGRGRSSWQVSLEVWSLRTKAESRWAAQAAFGNGGAWRTLPAAMLAAARAVEAQWEDERVASEAQAAF